MSLCSDLKRAVASAMIVCRRRDNRFIRAALLDEFLQRRLRRRKNRSRHPRLLDCRDRKPLAGGRDGGGLFGAGESGEIVPWMRYAYPPYLLIHL